MYSDEEITKSDGKATTSNHQTFWKKFKIGDRISNAVTTLNRTVKFIFHCFSSENVKKVVIEYK